MAQKIMGFWARICGFLVGVISTIFGGANGAKAYDFDMVNSDVWTCADQNPNWHFWHPHGSYVEEDYQYNIDEDYGDYNVYAPGLEVNSSSDIDLAYLYEEVVGEKTDYSMYYCNPACGCPGAQVLGAGEEYDESCLVYNFDGETTNDPSSSIPYYNNDTKYAGGGYVAYFRPVFKGNSYYYDTSDERIKIVGFCYEYEVVLAGCGYDSDSAGLVFGKLTDGRSAYLTQNNVIQTNASTTAQQVYNKGFHAPVSYTNPSATAISTGASSVMNDYALKCSSCNIPTGVTANMITYEGSKSVGGTFSGNECYFTAKGSQTGMSLLSDTSGSFYYPLVNGSLNKCYYNQNSGNGVTSST